MKVVAIIPARLESTRFRHKLIQKLNDKPIIINVYENILKASSIDDCIVATDSQVILDICNEYKAKCVMTSEHHTSGTSRIIEVAKSIEADIIINVQGDEPLVNEKVLNPLIDSFTDNNIDIATLKLKIDNNSNLINDSSSVKVVCDKDDYAMYFSRATIPFNRDNDFTADYYKHIGVYAFRKEALLKIESLIECEYEKIEKLEQLRWLYNKMKIKVIETKEFIHGVDTKEDLDFIKKIIKNN